MSGPALSRLRSLLAPLSPRRRRWQRFLASLPVDPDRFAADLAPPGPDDFIICGAPRTGTTLVAAQLFQPPSVVTVMEPWDGFRLEPQALFASLRNEIESTGALQRGKLDVRSLQEDGKVAWTKEGEHASRVEVEDGWRLGVKWPGFWRYLEHLPETRFVVCLRDPVDVLNSYRQKGGRLARGLEYDVAFHQLFNRELLAATDDDATRRVLMYEHVHRAILPHLERSNVLTVRYERWFSDPETVMSELGHFLGIELGPGPARIRPSARSRAVPDEEIELLRRHAPTIRDLEYDLG